MNRWGFLLLVLMNNSSMAQCILWKNTLVTEPLTIKRINLKVNNI